jgi:hypothetical protein
MADTSEQLDLHQKHHIQEIVGLLLYYIQAVINKLLVALRAIAAQQSCATIATKQAVHLLLDYVATYPSDGIIIKLVTWSCVPTPMQDFSMRLSPAIAPEHTSFSQRTGHSAFHWCCSLNCPNHQVFMASAAKSELAALFVMAREMIPHRQTLISMGSHQPKSPIQTNNPTTAGVTKKTIVPRQAKMMDMHFWWIHCRASQDQFCYY